MQRDQLEERHWKSLSFPSYPTCALMLNYRDFPCVVSIWSKWDLHFSKLYTVEKQDLTRFTSYLSICQFSHALVVADWRPQVTLHVHLPLMVIFRDGKTGYQHTEPKVTVTRHDGCLLDRCLLTRSQGAIPGTSPPSNFVGISPRAISDVTA